MRAANALVKLIQKSREEIKDEKKSEKKPGLFDGGEEDESEAKETPIWLVFTAKNHILDSNRLKPGKMYAFREFYGLDIC